MFEFLFEKAICGQMIILIWKIVSYWSAVIPKGWCPSIIPIHYLILIFLDEIHLSSITLLVCR